MTEQEFRDLGNAQVGKPYIIGAAGPDTFDCSGLLKFMLRHAGIVPEGREAQLQHDWFHAGNGSPVAVDALRFGDVCFYGADALDVHHVTISWDGGKVLEAGKGTRATTTIALAEAAGAMVMVSPLNRHPNLLDAFRPRYPWRDAGATDPAPEPARG